MISQLDINLDTISQQLTHDGKVNFAFYCNKQQSDVILKNIDKDGTVLNVSGGTGMGYDADHYKNILIAPMAYGQSLTILALVEALQLAE